MKRTRLLRWSALRKNKRPERWVDIPPSLREQTLDKALYIRPTGQRRIPTVEKILHFCADTL